MIVKVQKPLASNDPTPAYLVHDRPRTFTVKFPVGGWEDLDEAMADSPKRFFHADLDTGGNLNIDTIKPCPDQDW